jgi:hypothetical protein
MTDWKNRRARVSESPEIMLQSTIEVLRSVLKSDPTVSPAERTMLLAQLRHGGKSAQAEPVVKSEARLVRRAEAARRLACSMRTIDKLAATGALQRRKLPGRCRASGFLLSDVDTLVLADSETNSQATE